MTYPTNQIPSINPQNISLANPVGLQTANRAPTAQDNTFVPGSEWQNTTTGFFYKCVSATIAGAVWVQFVPNSSGTVSTLTGNSGGAVGPSAGNINVVGDGTTINIIGNPGTNTLTASLVGGGVASQSYITNLNSPVVPTSAGVIDLNASTSTYTDGSVANTIKIELQGTNHALFVGRGVHSPATTIPTGTSGQALVSGGAAADPAFGTLGVVGGGTGEVLFTPYAVITGGTTAAGPLQNVVGVGTSGQVLTSTGASALPTWQTPTPFSTGTWTPSLEFGGASTGITYASGFPVGYYSVIGNMVYVHCEFSLTSIGSASGDATIAGLPFPVNSQSNYNPVCSVFYGGSLVVTAGNVPQSFQFINGQTFGQLNQYNLTSGLNSLLTNTNFSNISYVVFDGWYQK